MWVAGANGSLGRPRAELALLLLASSLVVLALGIATMSGAAPAEWRATLILLLSAAAGGTVLAAAMSVMALLQRGGRSRHSRDEIAELRKNLLTAEAIIKAEPQVLVLWEQGQGVRVVMHTLAGVPGLPAQQHADVVGERQARHPSTLGPAKLPAPARASACERPCRC